ncbi:unnamed protein product, partial [Closterium sp. NIES-53]
MASRRVLVFDPEGRPVAFDTWNDDLQLYLLSDLKDSVSLFGHVSGAIPAPPATANVSTRSLWLSRDATARLAICNHLPATECAHFGEHRTAQALYDAVFARYSSPATAAIGRLLLPYLFPELSAFATVADLVTHLRTSDARYCATVPAEFLPTNQPPIFITLYFIVTRLPDSLCSVRDHLLTLDPTSLTVDLLEQHLVATETSAVATSQFLRTSVLLRLVRRAATARARVAGVVEEAAVVVEVAVGTVVGAAVEEVEAVVVVAAVGLVAAVEARVVAEAAAEGVAALEAVGPVVVGLDLGAQALVVVEASTSSVGARPRRPSSSTCGKYHTECCCFAHLDDAWRVEFGDDVERPHWVELLRSGVAIFDLDFDVIMSAMYALSFSAEGDCYRCVPPDPGIAAAALGASASGTTPGTAPAEALHIFTLDSGASSCFFRDSTTLTPLPAPDPVRLADPSGGPVVASSSTVLPCPAVPSGSLLFFGTTAWVTPPCHAFVACTPVSLSAQRTGPVVVVVLIPWIRTIRLQLSEQFGQDLPVLRLHSDRGGEFSSDLLRDFCRGEGITQSFTLLDSPQQNGIAERLIGLVMEVAQTSPTLRWTGKVGDASVFRVWGSRAFVRDTSADKLFARAIPCVFLGIVPDAPGWQFYHPTLRRVLPSQDVTFDESVPFYRLFPYRSAPPPPLLLFLAPGPPPVDPLPPQGPAPSGVSLVDPLPGPAPVQVAVVLGAAPGAAFGGAASGGAEPGGAGSEGAGSGGAEPEGVEPGGAESEGAEPGGAESEGAESGGAEPRGAALSGGPACASPRLYLQQLREWLIQRAHRRSGAPGAGEPGDTGARGGAVTTGAGDPTEPGEAGAGGAGAGVARVGGPGAGGAGVAGAGAVDPGAGGAGGTVRPHPYFVPLLQQLQPPLQPASPLPVPSPYTEQSGGLTERREPASRHVSPVRTAHRAPRLYPPPVLGTHTMALRPSFVPLRVPLPAPPESSLPEVPDLESDRARAASPTVARLLATTVSDPSFEFAAASALVAELLDFAAACHLDYASALVAESVPASPPSVGGECALGTDVLEDRQKDFECLAAAVPCFASLMLAPEGDPDALDIPTPRSYAEAIT